MSLATLIPVAAFTVAELWAVIMHRTVGTLSNSVWVVEGNRYSLRWFVVWFLILALGSWTLWHFAMESPGWRQLVALLAVAPIVAVALWFSYR